MVAVGPIPREAKKKKQVEKTSHVWFLELVHHMLDIFPIHFMVVEKSWHSSVQKD